PEVLSRRVLATRQDNDAFGPLVAAAAWGLGVMAAPRRGLGGGGGGAHRGSPKKEFPRLRANVEFIPALRHGFAAGFGGRGVRGGLGGVRGVDRGGVAGASRAGAGGAAGAPGGAAGGEQRQAERGEDAGLPGGPKRADGLRQLPPGGAADHERRGRVNR